MPVDANTVRIEVAQPDRDTFLTDNRFEGGGAGWLMPAGALAYKRDEYKVAALEYDTDGIGNAGDYRGPEPYAVFDTTNSSGAVYSSFYPQPPQGMQTPSMWVYVISGGPITLSREFYDFSGNLMATQQFTSATPQTTSAAAWTRIAPLTEQPSSGTAYKLRLKLTGTGVYGVRDLRMQDVDFDQIYWQYKGKTPPDQDSFDGAHMRTRWYDVTATCQSVSIKRGCRPNPPVDQLEIGTADIRFKTAPTYNRTTQYGPIAPGWRVRVSGKVGTEWVSVFEGRLNDIIDFNDGIKQYVEYQVTDRVANIAREQAPGIRGTSITAQMQSVLNPGPQNWQTPKGPDIRFIGAPGVVLNGNEPFVVAGSANKLDLLLTLRNGDFGLLYCDKVNQLQYISGQEAAVVPERRGAQVLTFVGKDPKPGEKTYLVQGYDAIKKNDYSLNYLEVSALGVDAQGKSVTVGSYYSDRGAVISRGRKGAAITHVHPNSTQNPAVADAYLSQFYNVYNTGLGPFHNPVPALDQIMWNATDDVASVAQMEIYDSIKVFNTNSYEASLGYSDIVHTYRVIGMEHEIKPGSWITRLSIRTKETSDKTSFTPTQSGAL